MVKQGEKQPGRPKIGKGFLVGVRFRPEGLDQIDAYIVAQKVTLTRPQAIRRIVADYFHDRGPNGRRKT